MNLEDLIHSSYIENDKLECKAMLNRTGIIGWLKTIAGFANAEGGELYIGVEDKTGKLIGFDQKSADNERNYFNNQVNEHLLPRPNLKIEFLPYEIHESKRYIIRIKVEESTIKPVVLKFKNIPSIFMRRNGFTNGATYEEIIEMCIKSKITQYDVLPSGIKYNAKDFSMLFQFYRLHNKGKTLTEKSLKSIGFMNSDDYLLNGALFFMDHYDGNKTTIQCSVFSGFNRGSERIVTKNEFHGNITSLIENTISFLEQRMNHALLKLNTSHITIDAYPHRSLFEAIINAIVHRDYYLDGTQIQIDMFKDRLEISSPGSFYRGEKIEKTYDLSNIISKRRNELISKILVACNVMESAGTGFDKIMEDYKNEDSLHKPYIFSTSDHFTLVLPDLTYQKGIRDASLPILTTVLIPNGTKYDQEILSFCYMKPRRISEIAAHIGIKDSSYFRERILKNLADNQYLIQSKEGNATCYRTNKDLVEKE